MGKNLFNIYVCSDLHFGHWNIIEYCKRPFLTLHEMDKKMKDNWNRIVRPQDMVIVIGDFVWTGGKPDKIKEYLSKLNGRIILVVGNHDRKGYSWYMTNGINFACDRFVWDFNGKRILFVHDPANVSVEERQKYDYVIHGHQHGNVPFIHYIEDKTFINVSVENIKYEPTNLIILLSRLSQGFYKKKV